MYFIHLLVRVLNVHCFLFLSVLKSNECLISATLTTTSQLWEKQIREGGGSYEDKKWKVLMGCFRTLNRYDEVMSIASSYKREFRIYYCKLIDHCTIEVREMAFPILREPVKYADQMQQLIEHVSCNLLQLAKQKPPLLANFTKGKNYVYSDCSHFGLYVRHNEQYVREKFGGKYLEQIYEKARSNK